MRVANCEQGSNEWLWARCGRITASRICDVMATLKNGGEAAARRNYRTELLCERLTGRTADHYVSPAMAWGNEQEGFARTAYELETDSMADQVGFIFHPRHDFSGASPDSLIGTDGGLEIKCPTTANHLTWMVQREVPEEHRDQCYWNMACAERAWWDFESFDSRLPKNLQKFIVRLHRDDARIAKIEREVLKLNAEVEYMIAELGAESLLPPIESFCDYGKTVRIGSLDVPADVAEMIGERGFTP